MSLRLLTGTMLRLANLKSRGLRCPLLRTNFRVLQKLSNINSPCKRFLASVNSPSSAQIELEDLIRSNSGPKRIFEHVSANLQEISPQRIEDFIISLLKLNNLNAVTCLTHLCLDSQRNDIRMFSNQFWALLTSSAVSNCHHSAALLVYHEIVNPIEKYTDKKEHTSDENEYTPFLLLPTAIEDLAIVFARHGNFAAVQGLRAYFQRYFSYLGHCETYKSLQALIIESHAQNNDMKNALDRFSDFAMKFRGHGHYKAARLHEEALQNAVEKNSENRQVIIRKGYQAQNLKSESECGGTSRVIYNKYTLLGQRFMAMFEGDLRVADLPRFYELLDAKIRELSEDNRSAFLDKLLFLINKSHHSLGKFIIISLCGQMKPFEAIYILNSLISKFEYAVNNPAYSLAEEFLAIFRSLQTTFESKKGLISLEDADLLQNTFQLYLKHGGTVLSPTCYGAYILALLVDSKVTEQAVTEQLEKFNKLIRVTPVVDKKMYQRAILLGVAPTLLRSDS